MLPGIQPPRPLREDSTIPLSATHSKAAENAYIQERLKALEFELRKRVAERSALLWEINESTSPGGRLLPSEVLSLIFQYACLPIDFARRKLNSAPRDAEYSAVIVTPSQDMSNAEVNGPYVPIRLASVSLYWRRIACATSQIWTTIVIEVRERTAKSHASLLRLYLQNTGVHPFGVELDFRREQKHHWTLLENFPPPKSTLVDALQPIANVLFNPENAAKITTLRLIAPPHEWLAPMSRLFSSLEELSLGWPFQFCAKPPSDLDGLTIDDASFPTLQRLQIYNLPQFTCDTLTHLTRIDLTYLPLPMCLDTLVQCPFLEECHIHFPNNGQSNRIVSSELIVLERLEYLDWACNEWGAAAVAMQRIRAPALRRLRWDDNVDDPRTRATLVNFLSHAPTQITILHLNERTGASKPENWTTIFHSIPQIRDLVLEQQIYISNIIPIIRALTPGLGGASSLASMLPALRLLYFVFTGLSITRVDSFGLLDDLLTMVMSRQEEDRDAKLRIEFDTDFIWPEDKDALTGDMISAMVHGKLELDMWENGKPARWVELMKREAQETVAQSSRGRNR
ncbi:hypothetical protein P691DRAFT_764466 [Macrolepiota fuliginosa MF-IS2]|uniref:F-box domain-containing protein n=1 Tax=Macrolepiota fuliginosa MF-IS2 TaxID=1400762 RepID=A0A9P6BWS3_9AGAR|nr:hypothetical protein P691DRAFT_764466 [Macrolepiota fuliginosa MF-IS2]